MKIVTTGLLLGGSSLPSSPPSPLSTAVFNALRLLSPQTWLGLMQVSSRSPFSDFEFDSFIKATAGVLIPIFILVISTKYMESMQHSRPQLQRVLLLSPWIWQCIWDLCLQSQKVASFAISALRKRNKPLPDAVQELQTRLLNRRAYQRRRYTVYLPPKDSGVLQTNDTHDDMLGDYSSVKVALVFPGALVPSAAYAEVAGRLSDKGLIVIVPSLEPYLLAAPNLGTDLSTVCGIMRKVRKELGLYRSPRLIEWSLMGHSMGAFAAMRLYDHFQKGHHRLDIYNERPLKLHGLKRLMFEPLHIKDLVLMGVAPFIAECTNLSKYNDAPNNRILLIQASDDMLMTILRDGIDELYRKFPNDTTIRKDIVGGTHHGFASYSDQEGQITVQEQQAQVCEYIAEFLQLKDNR